MKFRLVLALMLVASAGLAQKKPERPKIHSEFYFGSFPVSREAMNLFAKDEVRLLLVGLHQGWELEKIAKETKLSIDDLAKLLADLDEERLAFDIDEFESRPAIPVIREKELEKLKIEDKLRAHTQEFSKLIQANWAEIETMATSLAGAKSVPKDELMYQIVVAAILWGGMIDAFFEDQTMMPPPPRRGTSQRYYGWLIEGESRLAGKLKREQWESDGHAIISIGSSPQKERVTLSQIRAEKGMILDEAEARRFRSFIAIFSRDKLLPFFKKSRSDMFSAVKQFEAGKYARVADVFSWYYDQMANGVTEELIKNRRLQAPTRSYVYATKIASR